MAVFFGPSSPLPLITSGLVGYWDALNSTSYSGSGSSWNDLSGNNNTASLINSPTFNSEGSFTLNGSNQYIEMAPNYPNNNFPRYSAAVSLSIWFKTGSSAENLSLFGIGNNFTGGSRMNMWISGRTIGCETSNDYIGSNVGTISLNTWYNVVLTNAGNITTSQIKIYVNGIDRTAAYGGTNNWSINISPVGSGVQNCLIGTLPGFAGLYYFPGTIAIPLVYNRALSASEVLQNFNATRSRFGV